MTTSPHPDHGPDHPADAAARDGSTRAYASADVCTPTDRWQLAWLGMDVALAVFMVTAALWQQRNGSAVPLQSRFFAFAALFLVINGVRQTFRNAGKAQFSSSPIFRAAFGLWLAALLLVLGWVGRGPLGFYVLHLVILPVMTVVTVMVVALYRSIARDVQQDVAERIAYNALLENARLAAAITGAQHGAETDQTAAGRRAGIGQDRKVLLWILGCLAVLLAASIVPARHYILKPHLSTHVGDSLTPLEYSSGASSIDALFINGSAAYITGSRLHRSLPRRWHPGLTVRVKWRRCARADNHALGQPQDETCRWHEKDVPVHPYTHVDDTWLHIFTDDQLLVIPSTKSPDHPGYPSAGRPNNNADEIREGGRDE